MRGGPKGITRSSSCLLLFLAAGPVLAPTGAGAQSPDLTITNLTLSPSKPIQGFPVKVTILLLNKGVVTAQPANVQWFPGENYPQPACSWRMKAPLAAKAQELFTCDYPGYPSWYAQIRSKAVVDPDNQVPESDEANNTTYLPLSVQKPGQPDLTITAFTLNPASPTHGVPVNVRIVVKNQGTAPAAPTSVEWFAFTTETSPRCAQNTGTMAPGEVRLVECTSTYATPTGNNKMSTRAVVDRDNRVAEANEANNTKQMLVVVR